MPASAQMHRTLSVFMSTRVGAADVVEGRLNQFGAMGAVPA